MSPLIFFKSVRVPARAPGPGQPSPLLDFVAGDFAAPIAGLWPAPHGAFLAAPSARRHLVCLALTLAEPGAGVDGEAILARPLQRALRLAVPKAPEGLARALERLGERAWSAADYERLLGGLASRHAGKVLRHRDAIAAGDVRALALAPEVLLERGLGRLLTDQAAGDLIAEAFAAIVRRDGEAAGRALAARWGASETLPGLIALVRDDLEPEVATPPFPGTERLNPLATKAALRQAAARYRNCLRGHLRYACSGQSAYYEWLPPPGAVLEITRDRLRGWTLEQARLAGNDPVPEPARSEIIAELRAMGVHVGRSLWVLDDALDGLARAPKAVARTEAEAIADLFGD
jgi:hypothetical protein